MYSLGGRFQFHCYTCNAPSPISGSARCGICAAPMAIRPFEFPDPALFRQRADSMWHYRQLLPLPADVQAITLGEGATPWVNAPSLAAELDIGALGLKNEMTNPTGSFKDRQVAVGITWARARGMKAVAAVSSGNVAASVAAYSARAGMRAVLFMHGQAAPAKISQAQAYGATVIAVDDPSPRAAFALCRAACEAHGWYHLSTAGIYEPWNVEGAKTIAYELYSDYGGDLPEWVLAPVGGGGLLGGLWRGFLDLQAMGLIERAPRMAGVQATGCCPLVEAIENGWSFSEHLAHPWASPDTIAGAIADDVLFDGHTAIPAIRASLGMAVAVTDEAMAEAQRRLARREGLLCEIATASAIAAIPHLPMLDKRTRVCCIVSGSGLKDLGRLAQSAGPVPHVSASPDTVDLLADLVLRG